MNARAGATSKPTEDFGRMLTRQTERCLASADLLRAHRRRLRRLATIEPSSGRSNPDRAEVGTGTRRPGGIHRPQRLLTQAG